MCTPSTRVPCSTELTDEAEKRPVQLTISKKPMLVFGESKKLVFLCGLGVVWWCCIFELSAASVLKELRAAGDGDGVEERGRP